MDQKGHIIDQSRPKMCEKGSELWGLKYLLFSGIFRNGKKSAKYFLTGSLLRIFDFSKLHFCNLVCTALLFLGNIPFMTVARRHFHFWAISFIGNTYGGAHAANYGQVQEMLWETSEISRNFLS